jgi:excisionase family DNA binding protein
MSAYAAARPAVVAREIPDAGSGLGGRRANHERHVQADELAIDRALGAFLVQLVDRVADAVVARLDLGSAGDSSEWLDSREAADYLGVHRDTLRRLAAEQAIQSEQEGPGCKLYFLRSDLDSWRRDGSRVAHMVAAA